MNLHLQRLLQQRQMSIAFDPPQMRLDSQHCTGHPPLFLLRGAPVIDLVAELPHLCMQGLQAVVGLQTDAQGLEEIKPMQGEGLLEAFIEAGDR